MISNKNNSFYFNIADDVCGPNASLKTGINCKSDCCPEPKGQNSCPDPCANACQCNLMYRRASNGTCILARECRKL